MHKQGKQLVKGDAVPPSVSKRRDLVISGDDPLKVGTPKEPQHGKVSLPMPTMSGGINEPDSVGAPENVPTPEIPM